MDSKLVPVRQPKYVVSADGEITPWQPQPPAAPAVQLTRDERVDAYRAGMRKTVSALEAMGFKTHYAAEHTASLEYRGYLFDFRIQRPDLVAHVGSGQIPGGTKGKHGGSIYHLSADIKSEFALQMIVGKEFSAKPLYVALDENLPDPAQHIYDAVVGFLAALNEKNHRLGTFTVGSKPELAPCGPKTLPDGLGV